MGLRGQRSRRSVLLQALVVAIALLVSARPAVARADGSEVTITPSSVAFHTVEVGRATSEILTLKNTGAAAVKVTEPVLESSAPTEFSIDGSGCEGMELSPGDTCEFVVEFRPATRGLDEATLHFETDQGPTATATLEGAGTEIPATFDVGRVDFGTQVAGRGVGEVVTVKFKSGVDTRQQANSVSLAGADPGEFALDAEECERPFYGSCRLGVAFAPTSPGTKTATVEVEYHGETVTLTLVGTARPNPGIVVQPSQVQFGEWPVEAVAGVEGAVPLEVRNTSGSDLAIETVELEGEGQGEILDAREECAGRTIVDGGSCAIQLYFRPESAGIKRGQLKIVTADGYEVVPLEGTGVIRSAFTVAAAPGEAGALGEIVRVRPGYPAAIRRFVIESTGESPVRLAPLSIESPLGEGAFSIESDSCGTAPMPYPDTCEVVVSFSPDSVGVYHAELVVEGDGEAGRKAVPLVGEGLVAGYLQSGTEQELRFGHLKVGSGPGEPVMIPLGNGSEIPVTVTGARTSGPDKDDFVVSAGDCHEVPAGDNCEAEVRFDPKTPGPKSAEFELEYDGRFPLTLRLSGFGDPDPGIAVAPQSLEFGSLAVGDPTATQTVTIASAGNTPLDVESVSIDGPDRSSFAVESDDCLGAAIPPGATCKVAISYSPKAAGAESAELEIASDAGTSPTSVNLTGVAVAKAAPTPPAAPACVPTTVQKLAPYRVTTKGTPGAPGVRARFTTGTPALLEVDAALTYRHRGHLRTVRLAPAHLQVRTTFANYKAPLPAGLRKHLPPGSPVTLTLTYRLLSASPCSDASPLSKSIATEVVRIARWPRLDSTHGRDRRRFRWAFGVVEDGAER